MNSSPSIRLATALAALLTVSSCSKEGTPAAPAPAAQPSAPAPESHPMGAGMQHPAGPGSMGMGMEGHAMLPDGGLGHR